MFVVSAFLPGSQHRVADVAGQNLDPPGWRNQRLGQRHLHRQRITQVVISQRIGRHHAQRIGFLPGRAARAPHPNRILAVCLLPLQHVLQHSFLEQIKLRLVPEEAGLVHRQVLNQLGQFRLAFLADQQPVIGVEGIDAAFLQPAQQTVLKKMSAALVEVHAALLIHQRLQQPQFRVRQNRSRCRSECTHAFSRSSYPSFIPSPSGRLAPTKPAAAKLQRAAAPRASVLAVLPSGLTLSCNRLAGARSLVISSSTTRRPRTLPNPVTQFNPPSWNTAGGGSTSVLAIFNTSEAESTINPASLPECSTTRIRFCFFSVACLSPKRLRRSITETILPLRLITPSR